MSLRSLVESRLLSLCEMREERRLLKLAAKKMVFTNGCFDRLHRGHIELLAFARAQGDILVVGVNSDSSVQRLRGPDHPIHSEMDRAMILLALRFVDYVVIFCEDEPKTLIQKLAPDVLIKGKNWEHYVSGRDLVESNGGQVILADMVPVSSSMEMTSHIRGDTPT